MKNNYDFMRLSELLPAWPPSLRMRLFSLFVLAGGLVAAATLLSGRPEPDSAVSTKSVLMDSDGDGIDDSTDPDDDNDGILDDDECFNCGLDYNTDLATKQTIEVTSTANTVGPIRDVLTTTVNDDNFYFSGNSQNVADKEYFRIEFPKPIVLQGIEVAAGAWIWSSGTVMNVDASDDGVNWTTLLTSTRNTADVTDGCDYGDCTGDDNEKFEFLANNTAYRFYRIYGVSGTSRQFPWVNELFFLVNATIEEDLDKDGVVNRLDLDSDNDGIPDNVEAQPTSAYLPPNNDAASNGGADSAYPGGLSPVNTDNDACPDWLDEDSDGDGVPDRSESGLAITGAVGTNGLFSSVETADNYTDVNGIVNNPSVDLAGGGAGQEVNFRKIPAPGGVDKPTAGEVNGLFFEYFDGEDRDQTDAITKEVLATGYVADLNGISDVVQTEGSHDYVLRLTTSLEVTTGGDYYFKWVGLRGDDRGAILVDDVLVTSGNTEGLINLTAGRHNLKVRFSDHAFADVFQVHYRGPDNGNIAAPIPHAKMFVSPSLASWHQADKGLEGTDGGAATFWTDQSTNMNHMVGGEAVKNVIRTDPAKLLNFNPSVEFSDGFFITADHTRGMPLSRQARSTFIVSTGTGNGTEVLMGLGTNGTNLRYDVYSSEFDLTSAFFGNGLLVKGDDNSYGPDGPGLVLARVEVDNPERTAANNVKNSVNGAQVALGTQTNFQTRLANGGDFEIGNTPGNNDNTGFNGLIGEVINYPWQLSGSEINRVETYLAIKYGITLNSAASGYLASDGQTVIWDNTAYWNNVTIIGTDAASGLTQKQSRSEMKEGMVTVGLGVIAPTNADNLNEFTSDKSFLAFGDDGTALAWNATGAPPNSDFELVGRKWLVKETGTVGPVSVAVSDNGDATYNTGKLPDEGTFSISLLVDDDGDFTSGATVIPMTLTGTEWVSDQPVNLNDGQFFTFARRFEINVDVTANQATCTNLISNDDGTIVVTGMDGAITRVGVSIGTQYTGPAFAMATPVSNLPAGFTAESGIANPDFTIFYTVRAFFSETAFKDYVVSIDRKACSRADLQVSVTPATASANEGESLTYQVQLTNAGPDPAVAVEVMVDLPAGLELLTVEPSLGAFSAGTGLWTLDQVPVGSETLTVTYRMR